MSATAITFDPDTHVYTVDGVVYPGVTAVLKDTGYLAYLDDGTMIVVENGRRHVGEQVAVVVTTVLQTRAGRMIFSKLKSEAEGAAEAAAKRAM